MYDHIPKIKIEYEGFQICTRAKAKVLCVPFSQSHELGLGAWGLGTRLKANIDTMAAPSLMQSHAQLSTPGGLDG